MATPDKEDIWAVRFGNAGQVLHAYTTHSYYSFITRTIFFDDGAHWMAFPIALYRTNKDLPIRRREIFIWTTAALDLQR